jgi:hypothetical protein
MKIPNLYKSVSVYRLYHTIGVESGSVDGVETPELYYIYIR